MNELYKKSVDICKKYNIKPKRENGQNFLIDEGSYDSIIEAADLNKNDRVLEVGPGLGFLTRRLANGAGEVVTVEIDKDIYDILEICFEEENLSNIELIREDVLKLDESVKYNKIVANLPYNISSYFLKQFLSKRERPSMMVLMLQKEVVERICANVPKMSVLAISVQYYAKPSIVAIAPSNAFWPAPKVDSAILKLDMKDESEIDKIHEKDFFRLVKIGFSSKRKMLKNNLSSGFHIENSDAEERLARAGLAKTARAQDLSLGCWKKLLIEGKFIKKYLEDI